MNLRNPQMFEKSIKVMNEQALLLVDNWNKALSGIYQSPLRILPHSPSCHSSLSFHPPSHPQVIANEYSEKETVVELSTQMSQYAIDGKERES